MGIECETCGHAATLEGCPCCLVAEVVRLRLCVELSRCLVPSSPPPPAVDRDFWDNDP